MIQEIQRRRALEKAKAVDAASPAGLPQSAAAPETTPVTKRQEPTVLTPSPQAMPPPVAAAENPKQTDAEHVAVYSKTGVPQTPAAPAAATPSAPPAAPGGKFVPKTDVSDAAARTAELDAAIADGLLSTKGLSSADIIKLDPSLVKMAQDGTLQKGHSGLAKILSDRFYREANNRKKMCLSQFSDSIRA